MRRQHTVLVVALAVALLASSAFRTAASPPLTQKKSLMVYRNALVNGAPLEAGSYRVQLAASLDSVTVLSGGKPVVTAPCRVGVVAVPAPGDTVHYRARQDGSEEIVRIVFAGSSVSIELGPEVARPPVAEARPKQ